MGDKNQCRKISREVKKKEEDKRKNYIGREEYKGNNCMQNEKIIN